MPFRWGLAVMLELFVQQSFIQSTSMTCIHTVRDWIDVDDEDYCDVID